MASKLAIRDPWPWELGFNNFFNDFKRDFLGDYPWSIPTVNVAQSRRVDDKLVLELDVPGVKKDDIKVSLQEGRLSVSWSKRGQQQFHTEFVGDVVEPKAKVEDGVLTVTMRLPQAERVEVPVE